MPGHGKKITREVDLGDGLKCYVEGDSEEEVEEDLYEAKKFVERHHKDAESMGAGYDAYQVVLTLAKELDKAIGGKVFMRKRAEDSAETIKSGSK